MTGGPLLDLDAFRPAFAAWLDEHAALVTRQREFFSLDLLDVATVQQEFQEALFAGGWVRCGWPEELGGLGGDARHRAALYDELGRRRVPVPESYLTIETLMPMMSVHAPDLARAHLTDLLRGAERWCQGFSEPDAGSDLASLRTKAVRDGDDWIVDGHKIWTSQATVSFALRRVVAHRYAGVAAPRAVDDAGRPRRARRRGARDPHDVGTRRAGARCCSTRCACPATGSSATTVTAGRWRCTCCSGNAGCTRGSARPGCSARSMPCSSEPATRSIRTRWPMPSSQSSRCGCRRATPSADWRPGRPRARRCRSTRCCSRAGSRVFDLVDTVLDGAIEFDDDEQAREWRHDYLFSRSAPIYGGSYEIQRQILADRVLGMPRG